MKERKPKGRLFAAGALLCVPLMSALLQGCSGAGAGPIVPAGLTGRILFNRDNKLRLINADGTNEHQVPNTDDLFSGRLSPDGNKIVTALTVGGNGDVYVLNSDGTGRQRLTTDPAGDGGPIWSGDGTKIAFASSRLLNPSGNPNVDIFTMNADGSNQKVLSNTDGDEVPTSWSADDSLIAFTSNKSNGVTDSVFVIGSDGKNERVIANVGTAGVFTPDNKSVIYDAYRDGNLQIVQIADNSKRVLFKGGSPALSPTGGYVVYNAFLGGVAGLYISKLDGTQTKLLVANAVNPSWGK